MGEGAKVSLDDEMGLACRKEPPDKGFYSNNDITLYVDLGSQDPDHRSTEEHQDAISIPSQSDSQHSNFDLRGNEQHEETQSIPHMGMTTRSRSSKLSQSAPLND
ncbi:unnamed protein product [Ilex paraguariensis]|uniref:Uncharacterized protein n=1 Tax=Ilex paraguariensis TaxID=185542 RepID=A0ABC8R1Q3_9AQUA